MSQLSLQLHVLESGEKKDFFPDPKDLGSYVEVSVTCLSSVYYSYQMNSS